MNGTSFNFDDMSKWDHLTVDQPQESPVNSKSLESEVGIEYLYLKNKDLKAFREKKTNLICLSRLSDLQQKNPEKKFHDSRIIKVVNGGDVSQKTLVIHEKMKERLGDIEDFDKIEIAVKSKDGLLETFSATLRTRTSEEDEKIKQIFGKSIKNLNESSTKKSSTEELKDHRNYIHHQRIPLSENNSNSEKIQNLKILEKIYEIRQNIIEERIEAEKSYEQKRNFYKQSEKKIEESQFRFNTSMKENYKKQMNDHER